LGKREIGGRRFGVDEVAGTSFWGRGSR
jgi:hypothetical protein